MSQTETAGSIPKLLSMWDDRRTSIINAKEQISWYEENQSRLEQGLEEYSPENRIENPQTVFDIEEGKTELHYRPGGSLPWLMPDGLLVYPSWNSIVHTSSPENKLLERKRMHQNPSGYQIVHRDEAIDANLGMGIKGKKYFSRVHDEETGFFYLVRNDKPKPVESLSKLVRNNNTNKLIRTRHFTPQGERIDTFYPYYAWDVADSGNMVVILPSGEEVIMHQNEPIIIYDALGQKIDSGIASDGLLEVLPHDYNKINDLILEYHDKRKSSKLLQPTSITNR